uniref:BZIP n=1 Tax=Gentiana crassa subsp. rigescens TaxID=3097545 RepID=A0A1L1WB70_9GENT|nr:bZIP [Gentiana rigescens]
MAQLPPRVPNIAANWLEEFSPQKKSTMETAINTSTSNIPSWVDEFLDFSTAKRGSHRRSMSDSVAFLEIPMVEECRRSSIPGGGRSNCVFGKLDDDDDEQLIMSMFTGDINVASGGPNNMCCSNSSSPSDHNNMIDIDHVDDDDKQMKSEPEEDNGYMEISSKDKIVDPKRIKRILANRQSAQRSRIRKLQYISELEHVVTSLQAEVSVLSPRVAFLDRQRLVLGVDNSVLKQRIAVLGQDKIFKDAHQEALKREIEKLRQVYYQQNMKNIENASSPDSRQQPLSPAMNGSAEKQQLVN